MWILGHRAFCFAEKYVRNLWGDEGMPVEVELFWWRTDAVERGSVLAGLRRGILLGLRKSAKSIFQNPELAALRQQDFEK